MALAVTLAPPGQVAQPILPHPQPSQVLGPSSLSQSPPSPPSPAGSAVSSPPTAPFARLAGLTVEDVFDALAVPDELLQHCAAREAAWIASFSATPAGATEPVPAPPAPPAPADPYREMAMELLRRLCRFFPKPLPVLLRLSSLYDTAIAKMPRRAGPPAAAATEDIQNKRRAVLTAAAVARVLWKLDNVAGQPLLSVPQAMDHEVTAWMKEVDAELAGYELDVLRAVDWQLDVPTMDTWLKIYSLRLDVLTGNTQTAAIAQTRDRGIACASSIASRLPAQHAPAPRRLAAGFLLVGLVQAKLLPRDALAPPSAQPPSAAAAGLMSLVAAVVRATGSTHEDLCSSARMVARLAGPPSDMV